MFIPITTPTLHKNIKNQYAIKKSLTAITYCVAVGRFDGSQKNPVSVGITLIIKTATQAIIPTIMIIGYVMAPLIFRVMESTFSV